MQERSAFHRPAPTSRPRCRSAISLIYRLGSWLNIGAAPDTCTSRVSAHMQLVPLGRTSAWARTPLYTYLIVISFLYIMHHGALVNDDNNTEQLSTWKA